MAGYNGFSKSNNATDAENEGKFPLTQASEILSTELGIPKIQAKRMLQDIGTSEWHHTSCHYNVTDYYETDIVEISNDLEIGAETEKEAIVKLRNYSNKFSSKALKIRASREWKRDDCCRTLKNLNKSFKSSIIITNWKSQKVLKAISGGKPSVESAINHYEHLKLNGII